MKADEYVNHTNIGQTEFIINRVKLSVKCHLSSAFATLWDSLKLNKRRVATKLMPLPSLSRSPLKLRQGFRFLIQWLWYQLKWWYLLHHCTSMRRKSGIFL